MIRHVVLFRFTPDHDPRDRAAWERGLDALMGRIPGLRSLTHGADAVRSARSWDHAIVADFDTLSDVAAYAEHPAHVPLIRASAAFSAEVASVDFALPGPSTTTAEAAA